METNRFHVRVLLTVTTGRLLTKANGPRDNGIGSLYKLLGWMTNDVPMTHQLPRFADECKPWLLRWFPELTIDECALDSLDSTIAKYGQKEGVEGWLKAMLSGGNIKEHYDVPRIPADDHEKKEPWDELVAMRGTDEGVIVVGDE